MGEKTVQGARLGRPVGKIMGQGRSERFTMIRSVNVFAGATRKAPRRARKSAAAPAKSAGTRKKAARSPEELADIRRKNLKKANRALKKSRTAATPA